MTIIISSKSDQEKIEESDPVRHPAHYSSLPAICAKCGYIIECIDVVRHLDFDLGNAIKYIWRAGEKDPNTEIQDLEKAAWYLADRIDFLKSERLKK